MLNIFHKISSSKAQFNFRLSSSSEASDENFESEQNDVVPPLAKNTSEVHQDSPIRKAPHGDYKNKDDVDHKSKSSTLDTRSSDENTTDPFALLELRDNVATENSTVDKVTQQVADLESKLVLVLKSLSEIKDSTSSKLHRETQLHQLISLCLSSTLEDVQSCYKDNIDNHVTTINTMLNVNDDIPPHIRHEKHIKRLEKEIR